MRFGYALPVPKNAPPERKKLSLCYVEKNRAWFTTQPLALQWGDDWGESIASASPGQPYGYTKYDREDGMDPWELVSLRFSGQFRHPSEDSSTRRRSVAEINAGAAPWLTGTSPGGASVEIGAGVGIDEFRNLVREAGGELE